MFCLELLLLWVAHQAWLDMGWQRLDKTFHHFLFNKPLQAAVHQLTKSLASDGSGLPKDCLSVALLPVTLDTPMNRSIFTEVRL